MGISTLASGLSDDREEELIAIQCMGCLDKSHEEEDCSEIIHVG